MIILKPTIELGGWGGAVCNSILKPNPTSFDVEVALWLSLAFDNKTF